MLLAAFSDRFHFFSDLADDVGGEVQDWVAPLLTLAATAVVSALARHLLRGAWLRRRHASLARLAPSISGLIYALGVRLFVELAPIGERLSSLLDDGVFIVAVIIVMNLARHAIMLALELSSGLQAVESGVLKQGFIPLMRNLSTILVFFTGVIVVLKHFNYDVFSLLTALGVGSLAVGLAAQPTLSNMISGFTLIIDRNLRPGDKVNLGGTIGDVDEIGLRSTRIRTGDGNVLIVPNSDMVNSKILNLAVPARESTCSAQLRVPLSASFDRVRTIALKIVPTLDHVRAAREREPSVLLTNLAEGCQLITISFWIEEPAYAGGAVSELYEKLLPALKQEGIELTGPML